MTLEDKVMAAIKDAMKSKNQARLRGLRAIKSAILLAKTDKNYSGEISDEQEVKILQKLVKQRKDSLEIYEKQGREDLAKTEREEIEVIEAYLPAMMGEDEIKAKVESLISESGASSMQDMGKVMGLASKAFAGKADMKLVSALVRQMLAQ